MVFTVIPRPPLPIMVAGLALACTGPNEDTAEPLTPCDPCALSDENNFHYSAELDIEVLSLRELTDIEIEWSGLTVDLRGQSVDPDQDIHKLMLVVFGSLGPAEVAAGLANDVLDQSEVSLVLFCAPEEGSCALSEFNLFTSKPDVQDYFEPGRGSWLISLQTTGLQGARALVFLDPQPGDQPEQAAITNTTSLLSMEVDLRSLQPVPVAPGQASVVMDWSGLNVDGLGNEVDLNKIDLLRVASYDQGLAALESDFVSLEQLATQTWTLDVAGQTEVDLATLSGPEPFTGIDDGSNWLLALECTTCENPVPHLLTVLKPVEEQQ